MKTLASRPDGDFQFRRSWWDSDYMPAILLSCLAGFMWTLIAIFASTTWDLDQSWYANSPAYLLPPRIALLWPVWSAVQAEDILGWYTFGGTLLVTFLMGVLPMVVVACAWVRLTNRQ